MQVNGKDIAAPIKRFEEGYLGLLVDPFSTCFLLRLRLRECEEMRLPRGILEGPLQIPKGSQRLDSRRVAGLKAKGIMRPTQIQMCLAYSRHSFWKFNRFNSIYT